MGVGEAKAKLDLRGKRQTANGESDRVLGKPDDRQKHLEIHTSIKIPMSPAVCFQVIQAKTDKLLALGAIVAGPLSKHA